jgi:hypothetical protein
MKSEKIYAIAARQKKAMALALTIQRAGGTAESARNLPDHGWLLAATLAKVPVPSPETRKVIIEALEEAEKAGVAQ